MSTTSIHAEWLSLLDISGPFLATPVLNTVFPQGLAKLNPQKKKQLRQGYEEWREAIDEEDKQLEAIHQAWIELVLKQGLELDEDDDEENLKSEQSLLEKLSYLIPETDQLIKPNYVLVDDQTESLMLIKTYTHATELDDTLKNHISQLCRANKIRLALVTNGEQWMLVDAPEGSESTYASWYSRLWGAEPVTLQAFVTLLGIRQFFVDKSEQLPTLFDESLQHQDEVTDALGKQVSRAVEVLIQALDHADIDRNRQLLEGIKPEEIYEAGLTIMMRLVFILSAEERGLLLLGDDRYESYYAISSLRMQLHNDTSEILERRFDAWARLLAVFRMIYAGIEHEALRLPALGSSLFDPDRFPFLEGRKTGSNWQDTDAHPLPIDNRTVRLLLDAIQLYQGRTLSYRGLDVEQIGYVYEGLLERTVERVKEVTLELDATKSSKKPWLTLQELEQAQQEGDKALEALLKERTASAVSRIRNDLNKPIDETANEKLLTACHSNKNLRDKLKPIFHLLKTDDWGYPLIYPENAFRVTKGNDRGDSGTHYTPKSLTEAIVKETLEPAVYRGVAEGKPREEWQLKSPDELLSLKICDPAMGSGAFLVQVCRWLSERLLEAWQTTENKNQVITSEGEILKTLGRCEPLSRDMEERRLTARRLIAERCLYGVDINPMAVELAKLSIWLITLSKGKPFTFLDHNLRSGDSLLGVHNLDQLIYLHMNPEKGKQLHQGLFSHEKNIKSVINSAVQLREAVQTCPIRDIHDIETMSQMDLAVRKQLEVLNLLADTLIGLSLACSKPTEYKDQLKLLAVEANEYLQESNTDLTPIRQKAQALLNTDLPISKPSRQPVHWCLAFPEVFQREKSGFDAIVGNPPFLGGQKITGAMGTAYRNYLVKWIANGLKGSADLVSYFFLQAYQLLGNTAQFGLLAVNTISEGSTREVGLEQLLETMNAFIYSAYPDEAWPGKAAVITSRIHIRKGLWKNRVNLSGKSVKKISYMLSNRGEFSPVKLFLNENKVFQGCITRGPGFILDFQENKNLENCHGYSSVVFPYINGKDLNTHPKHIPSRWAINFWDWSEEKSKKYGDIFNHIQNNVKPDRISKNNGKYKYIKSLRVKWWLYERVRPDMYHMIKRGHYFNKHPNYWNSSISPLSQVIAFVTGATKYPCFTIIPNTYIYSNALCIIASESYSLFTSLTSDIHIIWAWKYGSRMKKDLRYTHGDIFETFPFVEGVLNDQGTKDTLELSQIGELFFNERQRYMLDQNKGMTKFYNDFHDPDISSLELDSLRNIQSQLNRLVLSKYGWDDIDLNIGFHEVSYLPNVKYIRYTISEEARLELLYRLSMLNKERHELETKMSITPKQASVKKTKKPTLAAIQNDLFTKSPQKKTSVKATNQWGDTSDDQILAWLEANAGWQPKQKILNACQANPNEWDKAIKELLAEEYIEKKNTGKTALYRAAP